MATRGGSGGGDVVSATVRVDPNDPARYHAKRAASFCDRMLHNGRGSAAWTVDTYGAVLVRAEDVASGIMQSDHDVVAASASASVGGRTYRLAAATFNCEAQTKPEGVPTWDAFFGVLERHHAAPLRSFDAVCINLQESGRRNTMAADLAAYLGDEFVVTQAKTRAGRHVPIGGQFTVRCLVALSRTAYPDVEILQGSMCIGSGVKGALCSKGAAHVHVPSARTGLGPPGFRAVSAHLPIDTGDKATLGYDLRAAGLRRVARHHLSVDDEWSFVMGDLNFRSHKGGFENDELTNGGLLKELGLTEPTPTGGALPPTCKLMKVMASAAPGDAPTRVDEGAEVHDNSDHDTSDDEDPFDGGANLSHSVPGPVAVAAMLSVTTLLICLPR
jgi:hypothetical protein